MKYFILITTLMLFWSCSIMTHNKLEYITIYKKDRIEEVLPEYLVLKERANKYDFFYPGLGYGVLGDYRIIKDTLYLSPKYEYSDSIRRIDPVDTSIVSVSRKFLMKNDMLIDRTDYRSYPILDLFFKNIESIYTRLK